MHSARAYLAHLALIGAGALAARPPVASDNDATTLDRRVLRVGQRLRCYRPTGQDAADGMLKIGTLLPQTGSWPSSARRSSPVSTSPSRTSTPPAASSARR